MKRFGKGILILSVALLMSSCVSFKEQGTETGGVESDKAKKATNEVSQKASQEVGEGNYDDRINEILADSKEIERKWLIRPEDIPYDLTGDDVYEFDIQQTYISFEPEIRVRNYNNDEDYELTIKTNLSKDGLVRDEVNVPINQEEYYNLIKKKEGNTIHKTRYQFYAEHQLIAIDIFHGDLDGLAYMEIEFANVAESDAFTTPDWVVADVTDNINYKNGHLARYGIPEE